MFRRMEDGAAGGAGDKLTCWLPMRCRQLQDWHAVSSLVYLASERGGLEMVVEGRDCGVWHECGIEALAAHSVTALVL